MKKITAIEIAILFVAGLVPLLWYNPGYIISNGDSFPSFLNSQKTLSSGTYLWTESAMGTADLMPARLIYQYLGVVLSYLGLSVGGIEILFQILFLMGAGFSMFLLTRTVYPNHELAPLIAGMFYMFNFFVLQSRLNLGFVWAYAFLPLLMALLIRAVEAAYQPDSRKSNRSVIFFAIVSTVAFSVASINPANIALMLLGLAVLGLYELLKYRKNLKPFFSTFLKTLLVSVPINLWWLLPMLNVYSFSPEALNSQIAVDSWSWTHSRSSFFNLFWFNGIWGWLPEYVPYFRAYSNPLLQILVFVPFGVGVSALLFRSNKSRFNAFIMLAVLGFLFLAKGVHEPFGQVNHALYDYVPLMNMFREPASKFTMLIVLFMSLLIGYAGARLANLNANRYRRFVHVAVPVFLVAVFVVASFPLINNPLETRTDISNYPSSHYSSYVQVPKYWYDATSWINSQEGAYAVLFTPLDDFYMMPYNWGYYGVDHLLYRLIEKPTIGGDYRYDYVLKSGTLSTLDALSYAVNNGNATSFKTLLDFLNVKYILQRNDVNTTERNLLTPSQMGVFLSEQPYLHIVKSFGQLDIYEYSEAKPSIYAIPQSVLNNTYVKIQPYNATVKLWTFSSASDVEAWANETAKHDESEVTPILQDNGRLRAIWNTTLGLKIDSPLIPVTYGDTYRLQADLSSNPDQLKIFEYGGNEESISNNSFQILTDNTAIDFTVGPSNISTKFIRLEFYFPATSDVSKQGYLWIDTVNVTSQAPMLYASNVEGLFSSAENQSVKILEYQKVNPTKTVLTVNASEPFVIATSQALDGSWVATVNGQKIAPTPLYLGQKGFYVNSTGQFDITIEYTLQSWFYGLATVSIVTLVLGFIYVVYSYISPKKWLGRWNR
jgi:hypothetical protein